MKSIANDSQRIRPVLLGLIFIMVATLTGGCRICADCEDLDYPAYGGAWQRTLRQSGRVGSVFDPGGAKAAQLVDRTTPENSDQIERRRQDEKADDEGREDPDFDSADDDQQNRKQRESMRDREKKLREQELDDIESEAEKELREKELDDIEVRIIPGRKPLMINMN
jgi:hypothetical protein